jgi:hypothetical protein
VRLGFRAHDRNTASDVDQEHQPGAAGQWVLMMKKMVSEKIALRNAIDLVRTMHESLSTNPGNPYCYLHHTDAAKCACQYGMTLRRLFLMRAQLVSVNDRREP